MTSTNFNIGMTNSKNSSRVIKPPGGGHSDIFGITNNENEAFTPRKRKNAPVTTIGSCFVHDEKEKSPAQKNSQVMNGNSKKEDNCISNRDENILSQVQNSQKIDENTEPKTAEKVESLKSPRQRIPPGGFSSALW